MNSVPIPIRSTVAKTILCVSAVTVFGLLWSIASHDRMLLLLSLGTAAFGALKIVSMIGSARKGDYRVLECTVMRARRSTLLNRHVVTASLKDGSELTFAVAGRVPLKPGRRYRLYLDSLPEECMKESVPDCLKPARTLLGFELLE